MRHSRIATTMDIYAQFVPESQRRAVDKLMAMVEERRTAKETINQQEVAEQSSPSQMIN
jgi:hypothetical protein